MAPSGFHLSQRLTRRAHGVLVACSLGEQQRRAIARARLIKHGLACSSMRATSRR